MKPHLMFTIAVIILGASAGLPALQQASATTDCVFADDPLSMTITLTGDCATDGTILVPDGYTLDGAGYAITAVDPAGGHFVGAVVKNGGTAANVVNLVVDTPNLANVCDAGVDRLRGIMFEGASGVIAGNTVANLNQGLSGCQEGNAIEVRNAPFDGTHPDTQVVEVSNNDVTDYQKTGILANGDVEVHVHNNKISPSFSDRLYIAGNSIQLGFGAQGVVERNIIYGNQWCGPSDFAATAVLIFDADNVTVRQNNIRGNADVGVYAFGDGLSIDNNKMMEDSEIPDCNAFGYDIGIGDYGADNSVTNNKIRNFDTPLDGVSGGKNKVIPSNQ